MHGHDISGVEKPIPSTTHGVGEAILGTQTILGTHAIRVLSQRAGKRVGAATPRLAPRRHAFLTRQVSVTCGGPICGLWRRTEC